MCSAPVTTTIPANPAKLPLIRPTAIMLLETSIPPPRAAFGFVPDALISYPNTVL